MMIKRTGWFTSVAAALLSVAAMAAQAAEEMKPFILASTASGDIAAKADEVKSALTANGFEVVGEYSPFDGAHIIVATSSNMKQAAGSHKRGGYYAAQRVAITDVGGELQISYTNPPYMAAAYHVKQGDPAKTAAALEAALGAMQPFGPEEGMTADDLEDYHYTFGMEYFDEPYELNSFRSHKDAVAAVEKGLTDGVYGTSKVYRIDIPGGKQTVFGVAMTSGGEKSNKYRDEKFIMTEIDFKPLRSTAHLPYEILISDGEVEALHARFRIAMNFPDLSMMGSNSFMNIMPTPDAIREALTMVSGGEIEDDF